jgi:hypothetical protein
VGRRSKVPRSAEDIEYTFDGLKQYSKSFLVSLASIETGRSEALLKKNLKGQLIADILYAKGVWKRTPWPGLQGSEGTMAGKKKLRKKRRKETWPVEPPIDREDAERRILILLRHQPEGMFMSRIARETRMTERDTKNALARLGRRGLVFKRSWKYKERQPMKKGAIVRQASDYRVTREGKEAAEALMGGPRCGRLWRLFRTC